MLRWVATVYTLGRTAVHCAVEHAQYHVAVQLIRVSTHLFSWCTFDIFAGSFLSVQCNA